MSQDSLDLIKETLEDSDIYGYIHAGAYADQYDFIAETIHSNLSKDLSVDQIQNIIWEAFYQEICIGTIGGTKESFVLDRDPARVIIGSPNRFRSLALKIRKSLDY